MWAASSLIRRDGVLPGDTPTETGLRMRMQGLAFLMRERGLRGAGEAGKKHD